MSTMSLSPSPSSFHFEMSSAPPSTPATSPPPESDWETVISVPSETAEILDKVDNNTRRELLDSLLKKANIYSDALATQLEEKKAALQAEFIGQSEEHRGQTAKRGHGRERWIVESDESDHEQSRNRKARISKKVQDDVVPEDGGPKLKQPAAITGGTLKDYQLEGLEWMISLDQNGISGILADEMGLGKTLQTIAFNAYLREQRNYRPFLIVCPLSVLHNWAEEFARFAPTIPVCMYHGTPAERAELRRTVMAMPQQQASVEPTMASQHSNKQSGSRQSAVKTPHTRTAKKRHIDSGAGRQSKRRRIFRKHDESDEESQTDESVMDSDDENRAHPNSSNDDPAAKFPVVITTYEMIIKDRIHLAAYDFSYIVVDEGHRLKNYSSKLMQEIRKYKSAGRMLLTGTPLQNNLAELWSLLNFILPDIFANVQSFQQWFDQPSMQENLSQSYQSQLIQKLHEILKPFLLRRLKADVGIDLPPKKEYVIYAPLTEHQKELYEHVVDGGLRQFLMGKAASLDNKDAQIRANEEADRSRILRNQQPGRKRQVYYDEDDETFFKKLESGDVVEAASVKDAQDLARAHHQKTTQKQVNNKRLQNTVMQLRKVCSHPFLFDWPVDPDTHQPVLNEELIDSSGKMMILDRLLCELFRRNHKVLLFSQFTTMLDIIEDWAVEFKGWTICRIDGSMAPDERREQMKRFQEGGNAPGAPRLFLLSTRSGGLGINLTAADTVIFYDQDWNPQMDIQAQDRAHRIGQKNRVLIFRLVAAHTIETKIMQRAAEKRRLEALVIAKGKFRTPASRGKQETAADLATSLLRLAGEKIEVVQNTKAGKASVLSDEDLEMLLDRSDAVFADRGQGWTSAGKTLTTKRMETAESKKTAFAVYQAPVDTGNAALARMFSEED